MNGLPPEAVAAREKAFKETPDGEGGRCSWCGADHRFGESWWPAQEFADHKAAVAAARERPYSDLASELDEVNGAADSLYLEVEQLTDEVARLGRLLCECTLSTVVAPGVLQILHHAPDCPVRQPAPDCPVRQPW